MVNQNDGSVFHSPTAIVIFTIAILQRATVKLPNSIAREKGFLNCMLNPKLVHILVRSTCSQVDVFGRSFRTSIFYDFLRPLQLPLTKIQQY